MSQDSEAKITKFVKYVLEDIREEKCVLLIGPEIIQIEEKSITRYVHEVLQEAKAEDIPYYYQKDFLFLFKDERAKFNVFREMKSLYENLQYTSDIYRKILEIPFHVIISLNPDVFLRDACNHYALPHHFQYFKSNGVANEEIEVSSSDGPLIYNLAGSIEDDESLILDYEDLFRLLKAALGPDGLPNKLRKVLKDARSFLFLGFDFEKWYAQLLLQLLTGDRKGRQKFAINTRMAGSEGAKDFLLHQFQIDFLGNDQRVFDELYKHCEAKNMLRELRKPILIDKEGIAKLKSKVGQNEILEVLDDLGRMDIGTDHYDWSISIKRKYQEWKQKETNNTLRPWEKDEINIITDEVLKLINQIQQKLA
jgi:hypothetical protein